MANNVTVQGQFALPDALKGARPSAQVAGLEMETGSEGISGGYGVMRYKGKTWTLSYKGEDYPILRPDGDGAANSIQVVIVKAATTKSKTYFPTYEPGAKAKPVCWSHNAIVPAGDVPEPQSDNCALCPKNEVGSRVTDDGKKVRACSDAKRIAIALEPAFAKSITGVDFFEPLLLRIPAGGLVDFGAYGTFLQRNGGWPLINILTKIAFDVEAAFPKFVFSVVRALSDEEVKAALELRNDPRTDRIVSEELEAVAPVGFEALAGRRPVAAIEHKPAPVAQAKPVAPKPAPAAAPAKPSYPSIPDEEEVTEMEVVQETPPAAPVRPLGTKPAVKKTKPAPAPAPAPAPVEAATEEEVPEGSDPSFQDEIAALLAK